MYNPEDIIPLTLNIGYAVHEADWNWKQVRSPFARLYYVTEGNALVQMPNSIIELKPDHLYLIPSFTLHNDICTGHFAHYYLHLYEDPKAEHRIFDDWEFPYEIKANQLDLPLIERLMKTNPSMQLPQSNPQSYDNSPSLIENIRKNKQRTFSERMENRGIVLQLLSRFLAKAQPKIQAHDDRIMQTLLFIRKNITEHIDIDTLATHACMSKDHFIRIFKRETGETPAQYIIMRKIEHAEMLLITNEMSVKSIAYSLGFEDHSYFHRLFKKVVGLTPQEYREKNHI